MSTCLAPTCSSPKILRPPSQHSSLWPLLQKKGPPLCKYVPLNSKNLGAVLHNCTTWTPSPEPSAALLYLSLSCQIQNSTRVICLQTCIFRLDTALERQKSVFKGQFFWQPDSLAVVHINELLINNYIAKGCFRTIFESWLLFE